MSSRILIVEDDLATSAALSLVLRKEGFAVEAEAWGEAALERLGREAYSLLILDLTLPGMSGMDVCRRVRKDPRTASLPIIMATAMAQEADKLLGLELGADDYVTKPYSSQELAARVKTVLRRAASPARGRPALPPFPAASGPAGAELERQRRAAFEAYARATSVVKDALGPGGRAGLEQALAGSMEDCLRLIEENPNPLLAVTAHSSGGSYPCSHSVNVAVFSLNLGLGLGWGRDAVRLLGQAAVLHELRLAELAGLPLEVADSAAQRGAEVALHPLEAQDIAGHLGRLVESLRGAVPGPGTAPAWPEAGFPDITLAGHAIGLCDVYETLSGRRPWRSALLPHDAVKLIIRRYAPEFERRAMEAFIKRFSLYPPGSYVKLSSGELACVVAVDLASPLLPTVAISVGADGRVPASQAFVDLTRTAGTTHEGIVIVGPVDETTLQAKDGKVVEPGPARRGWF